MVPDRLVDVLPRTVAAGTDGRLTVGGCALADVAEAFARRVRSFACGADDHKPTRSLFSAL